jgi:hypothetical protein
MDPVAAAVPLADHGRRRQPASSEGPTVTPAPTGEQATRHDGWGWFLLRQSPYLLLAALGFIGVAYTDIDPVGSFRYWQLLPVAFGLVSIAVNWRRAGEKGIPRQRLLLQQALHWAAVLAAVQILQLPFVGAEIGSLVKSLFALHLLATATVLAGIYLDYRLAVVGVGMWLGLLGIALLEDAALTLALVALLTLTAVILVPRLLGRSAPEP